LYKDSNPDQFNTMLTAVVDRYLMLPLLYTAARDASEYGQPFVAPLWYYFPHTEFDTIDSNRQPVIGGKLMVVPQLMKSGMSVNVAKPPGQWFNLHSGEALVAGASFRTNWSDHVPAFLRGGVVTALFKKYELTVKRTYEHNLTLYIAVDETGSANSSLYFDDLISLEHEQGVFVRSFINYNNVELKIRAIGNYSNVPKVEEIVIYGSSTIPTFVVPGGNVSFIDGIVRISGILFSLAENQTFGPLQPLLRPPIPADAPTAAAGRRVHSVKHDVGGIAIRCLVGGVVLISLIGFLVFRWRRGHAVELDSAEFVSLLSRQQVGAVESSDDLR
jgi:hypothetical protein